MAHTRDRTHQWRTELTLQDDERRSWTTDAVTSPVTRTGVPLVRRTGERTHHRSANARNATRQRPDVCATETGYAALLSKNARVPNHPGWVEARHNVH